MRYSEQTISEYTNFDAGEQFTGADDVRAYFTREVMDDLGLGGADPEPGEDRSGLSRDNHRLSQDELDDMAEAVIANRWHCAF